MKDSQRIHQKSAQTQRKLTKAENLKNPTTKTKMKVELKKAIELSDQTNNARLEKPITSVGIQQKRKGRNRREEGRTTRNPDTIFNQEGKEMGS